MIQPIQHSNNNYNNDIVISNYRIDKIIEKMKDLTVAELNIVSLYYYEKLPMNVISQVIDISDEDLRMKINEIRIKLK